jgi:hypothetical protein
MPLTPVNSYTFPFANPTGPCRDPLNNWSNSAHPVFKVRGLSLDAGYPAGILDLNSTMEPLEVSIASPCKLPSR